MSILPSSNIRRYDDVEELVDISVSMPLFTVDTLAVYYGEAGLSAVVNVDYEIILNEVDYSDFTFRPLASLIAKIDALVLLEPTDRNTVLLVRTLPLSTAATPAASRSNEFVSKEFDRITMKLQQLEEKIGMAFRISLFDENPYVDMIFPAYSAGKVIAWSPTDFRLVNTDDAVFQGEQGPPGLGFPAGGTTGQVLVKASNANYDTTWQTIGSLTDGDKGDIVVSGVGTVWSFDSSVVSTFARTVLDDTTAGAMLTTLGVSAFVQTIFDDANAAAVRTTLGLGTAATVNTGLAAGNVPLLDGSGLLDTAVLPALAITDVFVVASQAAMLALTAQKGDIAIRSDLNKSFALSTNSPGTLADWKELLTPTDAVLSVAGLTGAITAAALKTALAIVVADITDMSANGRSFVQAANYAAMTALLSAMIGDSGSGGTKGLVPAPGAGDAAAGKFLKADGTYAVPAGGGAGKPRVVLRPTMYEPPATLYAVFGVRNQSPHLAFNDATDWAAVWTNWLSDSYAGGGLAVDIYWRAATATTGNVVWQAAFEALASQDTDSDGFASAQSATGAANGTSGVYTKTTISFTNGAQMDSIAAGEPFRLKVNRDADNGSDTMTGDAQIMLVVIREP